MFSPYLRAGTPEYGRLQAKLQACRSLVVITGAGVSAESGIATFRGISGYWKQFRPEVLASPEGFFRDPALVWRWYNERRENILKSVPNPGHLAIAGLEAWMPEFLLVTQNVDGLHAQAGSKKMVEIHGSIWEVACTREKGRVWTDRNIYTQFPLYCECGALARPNVLWFGESYDPNKIHQAQSAVAQADIVMIVGTSGMVWIVSGLLQFAPQKALSIEINIEPSELSAEVDVFIQAKSGEALPILLEQMQAKES